MSNEAFTNIFADGEVAGRNPDAVDDYYKVTDAQQDHNYWQAKITEALAAISNDPSKKFFILYGGVVTDAGSGAVNVSAGAAVTVDSDGNPRLVVIPALSSVNIPTGWNDDRQIWLIAKYDYKYGASTREHYIGTSYHYQLEDTYLGDTDGYAGGDTDDLFVDSDPNTPSETTVVWGSFSVSALNVFTDLSTGERSVEGFNTYSDIAPTNLVYNSDFLKFSNRDTTIATFDDYAHPDGWAYSDDGSDGVIGNDTSSECCKMVTSSDGTSMYLKQGLHEFLRWGGLLKGRRVTAKFRVKASSNVSVRLYDGVSTVSKSLTGSGSIEEISLGLTVSGTATGLWVDIITSDTSETLEIYEVLCNIGYVAIKNLPCQISEIGLWQGQGEDYPDNVFEGDTTEIPVGYTRLESFLNGRFGTGAGGRSKLPEYQGRFLRVWDNGLGNDPDRATRTDRGDGTGGDVSGSKQEDAMQGFDSIFGSGGTADGNTLGSSAGSSYKIPWSNGAGDAQSATVALADDGTHDTPRISSESRGININVLAGIRWC